MKLFRKQEGFTLVELMVVVLIIGILVAIAIPVFASAKKNAQKKSCWANQRTIDGAVNSYQAENGFFPANIAAMLGGTDPYLKQNPLEPATKRSYTLTTDAVSGETACTGCPNVAADLPTPNHGNY